MLAVVVLVLGLGTGRATAEGEEIIAATFADSSCTEPKLMARPQSLRGGDCVFSRPYNFYYTISNPSGNIALFRYVCEKGCAVETCKFQASAPFGTCARVNITLPANNTNATTPTSASRFDAFTGDSAAVEGIHSNGTITVFASAWRVEQNQTLAFRVYNDHTCSSMRPYGQYHVDSALCTYSKLINSSFMTSYLDGRDSTEDLRVAYRVNCNQDCSDCAIYNRTAIGACIPIDNAYVRVMLGATPEQGFPTWELVVIIVCAVGGGVAIALIGLTTTFLVCRHLKRRRTVYRAIN